MVKRDTIQRVILEVLEDEMGGQTTNKLFKETVIVNASFSSNATILTADGEQTLTKISVVSNIKLDENINARYVFSDRMYKVVRQVKSGNEYFSILMEVNDANV